MYSEAIVALIGEGSKSYAAKEYDTAASHYADACGLFSEENGREDANLLLLYGKALFQNGVAHSGVLGGVSNEEQPARNPEEPENDGFHFEEGMAAGENDAEDDEAAEPAEVGHEESDEESADAEAGQEETEEEQSDFEAAWDILDVARALLEQKKEDLAKDTEDLEPPYTLSSAAKSHTEYLDTLEKLHETYDLLGEVSLESENFPQAARDLKSCLKIRESLYPSDTSPLVSESHYKLSLALEFCVEDPNSRKEAASHMHAAIENMEKRAKLETDPAKKKEDAELLGDLKERYSELQKDPAAEIESQQMDVLKGLLGEAVAGATGAGVGEKRKVPVNDLSSMVVKKKRPAKK